MTDDERGFRFMQQAPNRLHGGKRDHPTAGDRQLSCIVIEPYRKIRHLRG